MLQSHLTITSGSEGNKSEEKKEFLLLLLVTCHLLYLFLFTLFTFCLLLDQLDIFHNSFLFSLLLCYISFLLFSDCCAVYNIYFQLTTVLYNITFLCIQHTNLATVYLHFLTPIFDAIVDIHFNSMYAINPRYIIIFFALYSQLYFKAM